MGQNKEAAVDFLNMVVTGQIDQAYLKHVDMKGKHHNAYTSSGFEALKKGMIDNEGMFPNKKFEIKRVVEEGDQVVTHSHLILKPGDLELSVAHWFRFKSEKIVELWDLGQPLPKEVVNLDGIF